MRAAYKEEQKKKLKIAVAGLGLVVLILGACAFLQFTKPYAVSEDGVKVQEPWAVKIGDQETFVVASQKEGQAVIDGIKARYATSDTKSEETSLSPQMTIEKKPLKRSEGTLDITAPDDAVEQLFTAAQTGDAMVTVTTVDQVTKTEAIDYKTEYRISDKLDQDETKIIKQGQNGGKLITSQVVRVNGNTLSEKVISESVTKEPVAMIVAKGDDSVNDDSVVTAGREKETRPTEAEPETQAQNAEDTDKPDGSGMEQTTQNAAAAASDPTEASKAPTQQKPKEETKVSDQPAVDNTDHKKPSGDGEKKPTDSNNDKGTEATKPPQKEPTDSEKDTTPPSTNNGQAVVDYALQFVGNPYVFGGTSLTNGADCSGFTMSVYKKFGVSLPRTSAAQRSSGRAVSYSQARPGDLICYDGHVAIYIGNDQIVHASTPETGIKVSGARYKPIITVRRILE